MKKILLFLPALLVCLACTPMEEKRDALMNEALSLEKAGNCVEAAKEAQKAAELDPLFAEARLLMGRCSMKADNRRAAAEHYAAALNVAPDSLEALKNLSRIALLDNNPEKSAEYADKAVALGDDSNEIRIIRAGVFMKKKEFEAAVPLLEETLRTEPGNEEALVGLASAHINEGNLDKALETLKNGLESLPASKALLNLLLNTAMQDKDFASAESALQKLLAQSPDNADLTVQLAETRLLAGAPDKAVKTLSEYMEKHPDHEIVRLRLAELHLLVKDVQSGITTLDQAPKPSPKVTFTKANLLARAGRLEEAIALLGGLAGDPKAKDMLIEIRFGLAEMYLQKQMPEESERELSVILQADPDNGKALLLRGRIHFSRQRFEDSITDLSRAVEVNPNDYMAALALADAQNASGQPALAERTITDVISRDPTVPYAYSALAGLYLVQGRVEAALMTLGIGKASVPQDASLPLMEADVLISQQRNREARAVLEALANNKEHQREALLRLADVYGASGEHKKAIAAYDRLLAVSPDIRIAAEGRLRALLADKQEKAALAFAEKRQKDRPQDPSAAYMVAEAALANKNKKLAEQALLKALDLAPAWEQPLDLLVKLYISEKQPDKVISTSKDLLKKNPDAIPPAILLAMMQEQKGELTAAEAGYRAILAKKPDTLVAANNLAVVLATHKSNPARMKEAEELSRAAAESGDPTALDTFAWILHLQNKNAEAEPHARKARETFKENPVVDYHLAAILAARNDRAKQREAKSLLEKINGKYRNFRYQKEVEALLRQLK